MSQRGVETPQTLRALLQRPSSPCGDVRGVAARLLLRDADALSLAYYAACLFVKETCPYGDATYAAPDRLCALTLLNSAGVIEPEDALLQIVSPADELCKWALSEEEVATQASQLVRLLHALFERSSVSDRLPNAWHALCDLEETLDNTEQQRARIEALRQCISIDFRSARFGHQHSLSEEARRLTGQR